MRVLVSSDAGLVGEHILLLLHDQGHDIIEFAGSMAAELPTDIDVVVHHAGRAAGHGGFDGALDLAASRETELLAVLRSLHHAGFGGPIVVTSTAGVYGESALLCPEHGSVTVDRSTRILTRGVFDVHCPYCGAVLNAVPLRESAATNPHRPAAATSLHHEHLCNAYAYEHPGCTVAALRFHSIYGPGMPTGGEHGVIGAWLARIDAAERPLVYEDGGQLRDPIHVRDAARAAVLAITASDPYHGPLNVGGGRPVTVLEIATMLCAASDSSAWPQLTYTHRSGDVRHLTTDQSRVGQMLGFRPLIPLAEGLAQTWRERAHRLTVSH
ncbi:MAG: NAD-dependent epimerase/dehydratase family protein [Acidimicrobiia bacterium]